MARLGNASLRTNPAGRRLPLRELRTVRIADIKGIHEVAAPLGNLVGALPFSFNDPQVLKPETVHDLTSAYPLLLSQTRSGLSLIGGFRSFAVAVVAGADEATALVYRGPSPDEVRRIAASSILATLVVCGLGRDAEILNQLWEIIGVTRSHADVAPEISSRRGYGRATGQNRGRVARRRAGPA